MPPRGPEETVLVFGLSEVDRTETVPAPIATPVVSALKLHTLALVSHALPKVRTNVVEVIATEVTVAVPPVHAAVGVVEVRKRPLG